MHCSFSYSESVTNFFFCHYLCSKKVQDNIYSYSQVLMWNNIDIDISSLPGAGDVWFSLNGTIYQNNSVVALENIGEGDDALRCITDQRNCCRPPYTRAIGNWFFPDGSRVPSSGSMWDFYRTRGASVVLLHRRRGGEDGIYRCELPDSLNVIQTIFIGVYTANSAGKPPQPVGCYALFVSLINQKWNNLAVHCMDRNCHNTFI